MEKIFVSDDELNEYIKNRTHLPNSKSYLKYYIDKNLYDLFSYCIIYSNNHEIEFFTLNENYKNIWKKLKIYDNYGRTSLIDCGYEDNYKCYVVSVQCIDLIQYLKFMHNPYYKFTEKNWKAKARYCNWNEEEVNQGYYEYSHLWIL